MCLVFILHTCMLSVNKFSWFLNQGDSPSDGRLEVGTIVSTTNYKQPNKQINKSKQQNAVADTVAEKQVYEHQQTCPDQNLFSSSG